MDCSFQIRHASNTCSRGGPEMICYDCHELSELFGIHAYEENTLKK